MNIPAYTISIKAIDLVARIAEKVGEIRGSGEYSRNLRLRKINRLRSIQSSLAIENNPLTLGQVTDIIEGKRVLGLPYEIQEVKNAYQAYEHLLEYDPYKVKDFLKAHQFLTTQSVKDAGHFRSQGVGVFEGNKSDISVKKYFAKFVELGLLEVEGKNKGRKYKINKKQ